MGEECLFDIDDKYAIYINHFIPAENQVIFNEPEFFRLHSESSHDLYAQLVKKNSQQIYATLCFFEAENGHFQSPKRGTFGGLSLSVVPDLEVLEKFIVFIVELIKGKGAKSIQWACAPTRYDISTNAITTNILSRLGFKLKKYELNYDLLVSNDGMLQDSMAYSSIKHIRKCLKKGMFAEQLQLDMLDKVYSVISESRVKRGYPMTMSCEQLVDMTTLFPDRMFLFGVFENENRDRLVAAAVCISITKDTFYVFYWGDIVGVESDSPTTLLATQVYEFCQQQGFKLLDVGTSSVDGVPNYGLIRYKKNLGFVESLKMTFEWSASND